jgi:Protein of unknown function (DUF3551)
VHYGEEIEMRRILAAAAFLAIAGAAVPASAQDYPYCLQGRSYGYPGNCSFMTYAQCAATASGTDSYCGINPRVAFGVQGRSRRPSW